MTHTPGPWHCNLNPKWYPWPESIEIVYGCETIAWLTANAKHRNRDEANARLIAAAPDLLAVLKATVDELEDADPRRRSTIEYAREIIAKATGAA